MAEIRAVQTARGARVQDQPGEGTSVALGAAVMASGFDDENGAPPSPASPHPPDPAMRVRVNRVRGLRTWGARTAHPVPDYCRYPLKNRPIRLIAASRSSACGSVRIRKWSGRGQLKPVPWTTWIFSRSSRSSTNRSSSSIG